MLLKPTVTCTSVRPLTFSPASRSSPAYRSCAAKIPLESARV